MTLCQQLFSTFIFFNFYRFIICFSICLVFIVSRQDSKSIDHKLTLDTVSRISMVYIYWRMTLCQQPFSTFVFFNFYRFKIFVFCFFCLFCFCCFPARLKINWSLADAWHCQQNNHGVYIYIDAWHYVSSSFLFFYYLVSIDLLFFVCMVLLFPKKTQNQLILSWRMTLSAE